MKSHYSAVELADMKLPGLPGSERRIRSAADRLAWSFTEVKGGGGRTGTRREYAVTALPAEARQEMMRRTISSAATSVAASPASIDTLVAGFSLPAAVITTPCADLTDAQRLERDARSGVRAAIGRLQASGASQAAAITTLLTSARAGQLDPSIDKMLRLARDSRGRAGDGYPSERTLKRWLSAKDLTPKLPQADMRVGLCFDKLTPGGLAIVFTDWRQLPVTSDALQASGFTWRGVGVWDKISSRPYKGGFRAQAEYFVWGSKGTLVGKTYSPGVFSVNPLSGGKLHQVGKPLPLMEHLVAAAGQRIIDPFMGSATTGLAALNQGKHFTGIEVSPHYFEVALKRLSEVSPKRRL